MRRGRTAAVAAAAGGLLACVSSGSSRSLPPEPDLRIWAPSVIYWSPGGDREIRFAIENRTYRTLRIGAPGPSDARVSIFPGASESQACGAEPSERPAGAPVHPVQVEPGEELPVRIALGAACKDLRPGEYRYELSYRAVTPDGKAMSLPTRYGKLVVTAPARALGRTGAGAAPARPAAPASP